MTRFALLAALALSLAAAAQQETEQRPSPQTTPANVIAIGRDQLDASAVPTLGEFLQQLPQHGGALNEKVNNGGDGQTQLNLRNVGAERTLVLVDGKRMVRGGVGAGSAVDLNSIPTVAVERIEILLDGGSVLYGSDAIAGVVNVITVRQQPVQSFWCESHQRPAAPDRNRGRGSRYVPSNRIVESLDKTLARPYSGAAGNSGHFIGPLTECSPTGGVVAGSNTGPGFCYQQAGPDNAASPYPSHRVSQQWTLDARLAYRLASPAGTTTLALGVRNLLDQAPPRIYGSFLTYADPSYDFVGRFVYGRAEHRF